MTPEITSTLIMPVLGTAFFGWIAFLIKQYVSNQSVKDIEKYKNELEMLAANHSLILNNELARYKADLDININRQGKLYEERLTVIKEMHSRLNDLYNLTFKEFGEIASNPGLLKDFTKRIDEAVDKCSKYAQINALFFKRAHYEMLTTLISLYDTFLKNQHITVISGILNIPADVAIDETKKWQAEIKQFSQQLYNSLTQILGDLESEFRKLLGVEEL